MIVQNTKHKRFKKLESNHQRLEDRARQRLLRSLSHLSALPLQSPHALLLPLHDQTQNNVINPTSLFPFKSRQENDRIKNCNLRSKLLMYHQS